MRVRILVADQAEADFYDLEHAEAMPVYAGGLDDPAAHLHDRDLKSDRPGRVFDHASTAGARRGATAHHATNSERSPRKHEAGEFARRIAKHLEDAHREDKFDRLVVMAPPAFLGMLREALPQSLRAITAAEVAKGLVRQSPSALRSHLPQDVFSHPMSPA